MDSKKALHVIFKSARARGLLSLRSAGNQIMIQNILEKYAARFGVCIINFANVGTHLHIFVRFHNRRFFQKWLKTVTGLIARHVTGARKGKPVGKFWSQLTFTRVVQWGRDLRNMLTYVEANICEGEFGKQAREEFLWRARERARDDRERIQT